MTGTRSGFFYLFRYFPHRGDQRAGGGAGDAAHHRQHGHRLLRHRVSLCLTLRFSKRQCQVLPAAAGLPEQEQVPHGQDEPGRLDRHHSHHLLHHPRWPREHEDYRTGKEYSPTYIAYGIR